MIAPPTDVTSLLDELDAARAKATPGPWGFEPNFTGAWWVGVLDQDGINLKRPSGFDQGDAAWIVAATTAAPKLAAAVRGVQALVGEFVAEGNKALFGKVQGYVNPKLAAVTLAFSALGKEMTGLPIDFQIQTLTHANEQYGGGWRSALTEVSQ